MSTPELFPILSLRAVDVLAPEEMGSRRKGWVRVGDDVEPWLFKYARINEGVAAGEALDCEIGCVSRQFAELSTPGVELVHGCDLLPGVVLGYDRTKCFRQADHTLENILDAIAKVISDETEREEAFRRLAGFVVLDALVLNTDRHHENWRCFVAAAGMAMCNTRWRQVTITPRHSPATNRRNGWNNGDRNLDRIGWYALRGHGGIFLKGEERGANPMRLAQIAARRWSSYFRPWIERVSGLEMARSQLKLTIEDVLDNGLPRVYSPELYKQKCSAVFQHIYENYSDKDVNVYAVAS